MRPRAASTQPRSDTNIARTSSGIAESGVSLLVPAEMLGVDAGLGYFILDTRDRMAYAELMAAIVLIGCLGFSLDYGARRLHGQWLHKG